MKRTPDTVSKELQRLGRELEVWKQAKVATSAGLFLDKVARDARDQRVRFCEAEIAKLKKAIATILKAGKAKKQFWPRHGKNNQTAMM